jgi:hypothetical protein
MEQEKISWSALEYEEKERNNDWFWALGIIVLAGSVTSIIFQNYFFAVLLILAGILLGHFAIKKPEEIFYEINDKELKIKNKSHPFEEIKAFWVQKENKVNDKILKPTLFIKIKKSLMQNTSIPIPNDLADEIKNIFLEKNVPEEEMKEHLSEHIMEYIGF